MLVLTRKLGQTIKIGDHIAVKIVNIEQNKVQLGITAPDNVIIYRKELVDNISKLNKLASRTDHNHLKKAARFLKGFIHT